MRTVSSLCAFGAGIALAPTGLAVVREPLDQPQQQRQRSEALSRAHLSSRPAEMTSAVASAPSYHHTLSQAPTSLPFAFSTPPSRTPRTVSEPYTRDSKTRSGNARVGQKRTLTPRTSFSLGGLDRRPSTRQGSDLIDGSTVSAPVAPARQISSSSGPSWMRRLSSNNNNNMSVSRDPDSQASSRPDSFAISVDNDGLVSSNASLQHRAATPVSLPNKLVKRSTSLHSANGSPFSSPSSRLPLPVFRRPATSHQRMTDLQSRPSTADAFNRMSLDDMSNGSRDPSFRHYFTPKVTGDDVSHARRRSSSGIPTPIRRVYPDRRYRPLLVSAKEPIRPAAVEMESAPSEDGDSEAATVLEVPPVATASSPMPETATHFSQSHVPRRSFSIGNLMSSSRPQSSHRQASQGNSSISRNRTSSVARSLRKGGQRIVSAPQSAMGGLLSKSSGTDSERPAKRRDLTDPNLATRSIYSSSSGTRPTDSETAHHTDVHVTPQTPQSAQFAPRLPSSTAESLSHAASSSPFATTPIPPALYDPATFQPVRVSGTRSDFTSTVGSDSDDSVGDASTDAQTDTPYDSYPTRTTRSSFGKRGPHIETIFDDSPPQFSSDRSTRLRDLLDDGTYGERVSRYRHSTIEEEESLLSTPRRSVHDRSITSTPSAARPATARLAFNSSPPAVHIMPDPDEIDWDAPDEEPADAGFGNSSNHQQSPELRLPFRLGPALGQSDNVSAAGGTTPQRANGAERARLFDWSEVQPSPSHNSQTPPRPRTVHGKKDPENRGSRAPGRRAPSSLHARSHSVPVVPDVDGKRNAVVTNKFGTWGVGSKAATEDWNEDFEWDEPALPGSGQDVNDADGHDDSSNSNNNSSSNTFGSQQGERRVDSGRGGMFVPRSIREQQENVVANIGLLREWGILIEELKELRIRAVALGMLTGPYAQEWKEVDAMIDLADQETEEITLEARRSPPSSPGFDYAAFEEASSASLPNLAATTSSPSGFVALPGPAYPDAIPNTPPSQAARNSPLIKPSSQPAAATSPTRPRKDSEAVARSVIEALQGQRAQTRVPSSSSSSNSNPNSLSSNNTAAPANSLDTIPATPTPATPNNPAPAVASNAKKVPFDTATLRHIVPYVAGLKRKVKNALRETEGLYVSPSRQQLSQHVGLLRDGNDGDEEEEPGFDGEEDDGWDSPSSKMKSRSTREGAGVDRVDDSDEAMDGV